MAILLLVLALLGCSGGDPAGPDGVGRDGSASPTTQARPWTSCRNQELDYVVEHPADWRSNPADVLPACSLFDAAPLEVLPGTEVPLHVAVFIQHEPVPFESLAEPDDHSEVVLDRRDDVVAGRAAARLEVEATGAALAPAGTRTTRWVVRLAHGSLVARTTDVGPVPYRRKQEVLDRMVASLELPEPPEPPSGSPPSQPSPSHAG